MLTLVIVVLYADSIQFTNLSTSSAGYNIVESHWDFGDGSPIYITTGLDQDATHQYPSNTTPGGEVYFVNLIVYADSNGFICADSITLPVTIPSLPDIFYTFDPDPTCLGDTTHFYGESGFYIDQWHWDFDDGNFSTGFNTQPSICKHWQLQCSIEYKRYQWLCEQPE